MAVSHSVVADVVVVVAAEADVVAAVAVEVVVVAAAPRPLVRAPFRTSPARR